MSTRSIIGTAHDAGFEGRYCHWDGYPTCRGAQILATFHELGSWEAVATHAIKPGEHGTWSSYAVPSDVVTQAAKPETEPCVYCDATGLRTDEVGRSMGMHVPGGRGCNGCGGTGAMSNRDKHATWVSTSGDSDGWVTSDDDCGAEWAYLLSERGITVLSARYEDDERAVGMFGSSGADGWRREGFVPWDAEDVDWQAIEDGASVGVLSSW